MIVAFDLDGTLADLRHRLKFIEKGPKDWDGFFAACSDDHPIWEMIHVLWAMRAEQHTIEIWSGRSDAVRAQTEEWLRKHSVGYDLLRMRKAGDHRPDTEVKAEWLAGLPFANQPELAFDDRQQVVDMWRSYGVRCCQVAPGNF